MYRVKGPFLLPSHLRYALKLLKRRLEFFEGENVAVPFASNPDSVRLNMRFDIPMGDTASIAFVFSKNTNFTGGR